MSIGSLRHSFIIKQRIVTQQWTGQREIRMWMRPLSLPHCRPIYAAECTRPDNSGIGRVVDLIIDRKTKVSDTPKKFNGWMTSSTSIQ
jgi:predicted RNA-binding protein with PUA-like domain